MHVTFSFAVSCRYAKTQTSKFRKVVWQHTEGMVGSIMWIVLSPWVRCTTFWGDTVQKKIETIHVKIDG